GNEIVIKEKWVNGKKQKLINAIGSDTPGKSEIDPLLFKRAKIIVDFKEQAIREGEVSNPITKGIISGEDIFAELDEVIAKKKHVTKKDKLIIFDSTGDPIEDLIMVELILKNKKFKGEPFSFKPKRRSDFYYNLL
ncbi:MAG: hypothetical protein QMD22_10925, partial [archaeon]|nr:hypothetical protein [archaeon]